MSEGPYASLNLGRKSGDDPERADENRRIACEAIGADLEKLALNYQVHSSRVLRAAPAMRGEHADGLVDRRARPADPRDVRRLPADRARAHRHGASRPSPSSTPGWKGLLAGIVESGVEALGSGTLTAAIGPAIGPCCYEVGEEVAAPFRERFGDDVVRESRLDLWTSAERALRAAGVEQRRPLRPLHGLRARDVLLAPP